jgi:hypothetical protein
MPAPPDRFSEVRDWLLRIKMQLDRDRSADCHVAFLRAGRAPSKLKPQLERLREQLNGLGAAQKHELRQALDDALWGEPPPADDEHRVIVRSYNAVTTRGTMDWQPDTVIFGRDMPPLFEIVEQAIGQAIDRLEERKRGVKSAIGDAGLRAARKLIYIYCKVHEAPKPRIADIEAGIVGHPEAAKFALACLIEWKHPRAIDFDAFDLVRALSR